MKKKWVAPRVEVQKFEANEYVAACWGVKCMCDVANAWEKAYNWNWRLVEHEWNHCGSFDNQVILDTDNDGVAEKMIETGVTGGGTLECVLYEDNKFENEKQISDVKIGEPLYWTTEKPGWRTWHHQGIVEASVPGHPNRS